MELNNSDDALTPWGITSFDSNFIGLPKLTFNLLRTCNKETNIAAIGHFLQEGIEQDQRVALVCFDHPVYLLNSFKEYGFCFDKELLSEKLIYIYYKPFFSHALNFATDHHQLFDEIKRLSKNDISRIAFLNTDVLFNLETHLLAESSAERIMASFSDSHCTVLGSYQVADTQTHQRLDEVSQTTLSSYIEIKPVAYSSDNTYEFILRKSPVFHESNSIELCLNSKFGYSISNSVKLVENG